MNVLFIRQTASSRAEEEARVLLLGANRNYATHSSRVGASVNRSLTDAATADKVSRARGKCMVVGQRHTREYRKRES